MPYFRSNRRSPLFASARPGRRSARARTAVATAAVCFAPLIATAGAHDAAASVVGAGASVAPIHDCDVYEAAQGKNLFAVDFNYSAQLQNWVVPSNVAGGRVCVDVSGGQGGSGSQSAGGLGGAVNVLIAVKPGQSYTIATGGIGASSTTGGGTGGGGTFVFSSGG